MKNNNTTTVYGNRARGQAQQAISNEFVIDMLNRLPEQGKPGTPLGFMMGLGLSNQDTEFRSFTRPPRIKDGLILGSYMPSGQEYQATRDKMGSQVRGAGTVSPYSGEEDVVYFTPQYVLEQRGLAERNSESDTFAHELFHKGAILSMPIINDMLAERGGPIKLALLNKDKLKEFKKSFEEDSHHSKYLKAMNKYYLVKGDTSKLSKEENKALDDVKSISIAIDRYLTDDKKEKYGIRTPTKAARPKPKKKKGLFDKLLK